MGTYLARRSPQPAHGNPVWSRTARRVVAEGAADQGADERDLAWIQFDALTRMLIPGIRRILPPGWIVMGSARSDIHGPTPRKTDRHRFSRVDR
jgi:hypothetical protein